MNFNKKTIKIALASLVLLKIMSGGVAFAQEADEMALSAQDVPKISPIDALKTAVAANPDAQVLAVELVKEKGVLLYEVELSDNKVVVVDANSNKITATEQGE
jgi:uncharacterized membrane protein YkoI